MRLLLGEICSLLSALCLMYSTFGKSKKKVLLWQTVNATFYSMASIFLGGYSAVVSNILTITRNILQIKNRITKKIVFIICTLMICLGIATNNRGGIGILPITASVSYTILLYVADSVRFIQFAVIINMLQWAIFDGIIKAYPSLVMDVVIIGMSGFQLLKRRDE